MNLELNKFHRILLVGAGGAIITIQSINLLKNNFELEGIGWFLAYAMGVALIILGSMSSNPLKTTPSSKGSLPLIGDIQLLQTISRAAIKYLIIITWGLSSFFLGVAIFRWSGKSIPAAICLLVSIVLVTSLYQLTNKLSRKHG